MGLVGSEMCIRDRIKYSVQNRRPFKFTVAGCIQREKELLQGSYMHHGAEDRKRTKCGSQCQRFRCFVYFTGKRNPWRRNPISVPEWKKRLRPSLPFPGIPYHQGSCRVRRIGGTYKLPLSPQDFRLSCLETGRAACSFDGIVQSFLLPRYQTIPLH